MGGLGSRDARGRDDTNAIRQRSTPIDVATRHVGTILFASTNRRVRIARLGGNLYLTARNRVADTAGGKPGRPVPTNDPHGEAEPPMVACCKAAIPWYRRSVRNLPMTRSTKNDGCLSRRTWLTTCVVLLCVHAGCQTGAYRASQLPDEFRCAPVKNTDAISISNASRPGQNSSLIGPGDTLEITVLTGREDEEPTPIKSLVANDGTIMLPSIGTVYVAGVEPYQATRIIEQAAIDRGIYVRPQVALEVSTKAVNRVTVVGEVDEPGPQELPRSSSDLLTALATAGGMSDEAGTVVELRRSPSSLAALRNESQTGVRRVSYEEASDGRHGLGNDGGIPAVPAGADQGYQAFGPPAFPSHTPDDPVTPILPNSAEIASGVMQLDLADENQAETADLRLNDGDVVYVFPKAKRTVYVGGLVREPGQIEIPNNQDIDLLQAIQTAGDTSSPVADKVLVLRRVEGRQEPLVIKASIHAAKRNGRENIRLQNGDIVSVEQTVSTMVVDTVRSLLHFSVGVAGRSTLL